MIRRRCDTSVLWSMNSHSLNLYAMRLQSMCSTGQLKGNGVLGIRREDKNQWERRVPISPSQAAHLIQRGIKVLVQPSSTRCFTDQSYADVGAEITEDLSGASTIIAVKEVPIPLLIPERTYMMFSHTIKAQEYNMPLLDSILNQSIRLIDYERIVDADGRIVKFGPYAGFAGTIDTLHALGVALLARGFATPFLHISLSKEYTSLEAARKDILQVGAEIREHGLPSEVCPLTVVVTGSGSVSHAVQQILHLLPTKYVECGELPRLWSLRKKDRHNIYVAVATSRDMVTRKDKSSQPFNKTHYYKEPHQYIGTFHERVIPYTRVLINGMYWDTHYPKLLTLQQAKDLKSQGQFPLVALGDITCDPMGSVELLVRSTSIANPFFAFDVVNRCDKEIHQYQPDDVLVLGVDHLPAEFPKEASHEFGKNLVPLLEKVVYSDATAPLTQQEQSLGKELYGATVTSQQKLTPHFEYISSIRAKRAATQSQPRKTSSNAKNKYSVLLIGGGMCAGPVVELLAGTGNVSVTVVDSNRTSLDALLTHYTKRLDGANVRDLVLDVSCEQEQLSKLIKEHDVVVSLLPAFMHGKVVELAVEHRKHVATASYISPEVSALAERAKERGLCIIVEMGLDPGIDIMTSKAMIDGIRAAGGLIRSYKSACGALLAPENSTCPLAYKFSWSPRGVLTALARSARVKENGIWRSVPSPYAEAIPFGDFSGLNLVAVPNGDAEEYAQNLFQLHEETPDIARLTLRYGNFPPAALALNAMQLLSETKDFAELRPGGSPISWAQLVQRLAPAFNAANDLDARTKRDFTKLGILSNECYVPQTKAGTPRDSLSVLLAERLSYASHERDMVLMVHEVIAEYPNKGGKKALHRGILSARGSSALETGTAITVGIPLALSVCALLNGEVKARGLVRPTEVTLCSSVLSGLKKYNIEMHEEEIPL